MTSNIIQKVFRFMAKSTDLKWPDGTVDLERQSFVVIGAKPLVHVQDDIESAYVWCWAIRDHLIDSLKPEYPTLTKKEFPKLIDTEINKHSCLVICSDIANGLKHKKLKRSRSDKFAYLTVNQTITVNRNNVSMIHRLDGKCLITPIGDDCIEVKARIYSKSGEFIFDAYQCLEESLKAWISIDASLRHT